MSVLKIYVIFVVAVIVGSAVDSKARDEPARSNGSSRKVITISAEELGKQFAPDTLDPVETYQGQKLRVSGKVSMAYEPFVYLATGANFPTGQPVKVTLEFKPGALPNVTVGARVVAEGKFDRKAIFGPVLTECRILEGENTRKAPSQSSKSTTRKGRSSGKKAGTSKEADRLPEGPRAITLRFDSPIQEGDQGYRAGFTSFRLRFGPGTWRGTVVGESIAWGEGNQGMDHWGVGSGEKTVSSEVYHDKDGDYFIFSLSGKGWESERIAVLFRLTLPDGRRGIATALIPCR